MQDEVLTRDRHHTTTLKSEGNSLFVDTQFHNKQSLGINQRIRQSQMLDKMKLGLHDNEDVRGVLSIPSNLEWQMFIKKYPDIYTMLKSRDEGERIKALKKIQFIEPEWVVMQRH